jgi:hypothetical protein
LACFCGNFSDCLMRVRLNVLHTFVRAFAKTAFVERTTRLSTFGRP